MSTAAVAYCEGVTRTRARNFWYGIRLLPRPKREALAAVYALARRIDDVGDDGPSGGPADAERRAALASIEGSLSSLTTASPDPVLAAVAEARLRFDLPLMAFRDLIDGVRMDLDRVQYRTFDQLETYCRRVAGSVGRLSLSVFGCADRAAEPLADDLGVAMQLANVLRDIREDLERDRVYLPSEDLERFGCTVANLRGPGDASTDALIRFEAERARRWFDRGLRLLPMLDRRSAACAGAMAGIYRRLLRRIAAAPRSVLSLRISLPGWEKAAVAARALARLPGTAA
jgi:phytoene synthase